MIYELAVAGAAGAAVAAAVGKQKRIFLLNPASRSWPLPTVVASIVVLDDLHNLKSKERSVNCGFKMEVLLVKKNYYENFLLATKKVRKKTQPTPI